MKGTGCLGMGVGPIDSGREPALELLEVDPPEIKKIKFQIDSLNKSVFGKWPDKSTTRYAMLDFESEIENL